MQSGSSNTIPSPCVGLCSTTYGDDVCRGCMRTSKEIISWPSATDEDKQHITTRLDAVLERTMTEFFIIVDEKKLLHALHTSCIPFDTRRSPYSWLHKLLVREVNAIASPADIGITLMQQENLFTLFQQCRAKMYALATT